MFKKLLTIVTMVLFSSQIALAQTGSIEGQVTDAATGETIPGANIFLLELERGDVSDPDGNYLIEDIPVGSYTLTASYVGFATFQQTVQVRDGSATVLNIELEPGSESLDEVVVTAFGNQRRRALTGAVSSVTPRTLEARPVTSFQSALQGVTSGVSVTSTTGQPGAGSNIQIRGAGSINASTQPLYVIDGVPVVNLNASDVASANVLNTLNPNDIESISLLKDASASALYGSRAANGVVLITTKGGREGPAQINVRIQRGVSGLAVDQHETLDATEYYRQYWNQYYQAELAGGADESTAAAAANQSAIDLLNANPFSTNNALGPDGQLNDGASLVYDTDWIDRVIDEGVTSEYAFDVSGGNERTTYFLSGSAFDQEGILPNSDFSRGSFRLNIDSDINDFISVRLRSNTVVSNQNNAPTGGGANNPLRFANLTSNIYPFFERDANNEIVRDEVTNRPLYNYNAPTVLDFHPVGLAELDRYLNETVRTTNNVGADLNLLDNLAFKTDLSLDVINSKDNRYWNREHGNAEPVGGRATQIYNRFVTLNATNRLQFIETLGDHSFDAIIGQEYFSRHDEFMSAETTSFVTGLLTELSAGSSITEASSSFADRRLFSVFSRLNYGFRDKYYLTASIRRDGASEFGENNRWGTFGSIGGSWIISEESFMDDFEFIDILKLRASYGTTGNNSIGAYAAQGLLGFSSAFDYNGAGGSTYTQLANPDLKWEVINSTDIGLEFEVMQSRLTGEFVYWTRTSTDLLFGQPIPVSTTGFSEIETNLAEIKNSGIEANFTYRLVNNRNLVWSVNANITTLNNEITDLPVEFVQNGTKRFEEGVDRYQYFIQEFAGVDPETGAPLWFRDVLDENGDPTGERETTNVYSQADRYRLGSAMEDFYGGFGTNVNYKGFDLQMIWSYKVGGKIYDFTRSAIMHMGATPGQQLSTEVLDAWTPQNTETDVPRFGINNSDNFNSTSSRFIYDGDYMRLKNLTVGYTFDRDLLSQIGVRNLRLFISGENLLTFAAYDGIDPELPRSGNTNNIFPASRTITGGINLGF